MCTLRQYKSKKYEKACGRQRFKCKDCGKTFNSSTGAITSSLRLSVGQWKELLRGIMDNFPISKIAQNTGIAKSSTWINLRVIVLSSDTLMGENCFTQLLSVLRFTPYSRSSCGYEVPPALYRSTICCLNSGV